MALLTKNKTVQIAVEPQAGVVDAAALALPAASALATDEVTVSIAPEFLDASSTKEGLTAVKKDIGKETGSMTVTAKLRGTNDGVGLPAFGPLLRAASFRQVITLKIDVDGAGIINGPFRTGEIITQAGTGATAVVIGDYYEGDAQIYAHSFSLNGGTPFTATDVWTGDSTGANFTPSAVPVPDGVGYQPTSGTTQKIDVTAGSTAPAEGTMIQDDVTGARAFFVREGSAGGNDFWEIEPVRGTWGNNSPIFEITAYDTKGGAATGTTAPDANQELIDFPTLSQVANESGVAVRLTGSRGNVSFNFTAGEPVILTFESSGTVDDVSDTPIDASAVKDNRAAPRWEGAAMTLRNGEGAAAMGILEAQSPCLANFEFSTGLTLVDRVCATAPNGVEEVFASDRAATWSMDPEATLEKDIPFLTRLRSGDLAAFRTTLGTEDGNRFTFSFPGLQTESGTSGDREGIMTRELSGTLTGGNIYNATQAGGTVGTIGRDNEAIILWHRA